MAYLRKKLLLHTPKHKNLINSSFIDMIDFFFTLLIDPTCDGQEQPAYFTDNFCKPCGVVLQHESERISHFEVG
jgi:hypothetical protein